MATHQRGDISFSEDSYVTIKLHKHFPVYSYGLYEGLFKPSSVLNYQGLWPEKGITRLRLNFRWRQYALQIVY